MYFHSVSSFFPWDDDSPKLSRSQAALNVHYWVSFSKLLLPRVFSLGAILSCPAVYYCACSVKHSSCIRNISCSSKFVGTFLRPEHGSGFSTLTTDSLEI